MVIAVLAIGESAQRVQAILLLLTLSACTASVGQFPSTHQTQTDLSRSNFRVLASNASGRDTGFYLLGFMPILSPSYGAAMNDMRSKTPITGKAAALANVSEDRSTLYLVLFSLPRITVTADVIEFLPEQAAPAAPVIPPP